MYVLLRCIYVGCCLLHSHMVRFVCSTTKPELAPPHFICIVLYFRRELSTQRRSELRSRSSHQKSTLTVVVSILSPEYQGLILLIWFTLIPAWINNHIPDKVSDEITYPSQKLHTGDMKASRIFVKISCVAMFLFQTTCSTS